MGACQAGRQHSDGEGQAQAAVQAEQPSLGVLEGDVGVGERAECTRERASVMQLRRLLRGRSVHFCVVDKNKFCSVCKLCLISCTVVPSSFVRTGASSLLSAWLAKFVQDRFFLRHEALEPAF